MGKATSDGSGKIAVGVLLLLCSLVLMAFQWGLSRSSLGGGVGWLVVFGGIFFLAEGVYSRWEYLDERAEFLANGRRGTHTGSHEPEERR